MPIEAICPSGHKILCPDDRAGRTAKCPRCGAPFRVPSALVTAAVGSGGAGSAANTASGASSQAANGKSAFGSADSTADSGAALISPAGDELIVFLCPNGHKLNGPARLAGKTGQCPHCGVQFEIPFAENTDEGEEHDGLADTVTEEPLLEFPIEAQVAAGTSVGDTPVELAHLFEAVRADTESSVVSRIAARSSKSSANPVKGASNQTAPQTAHAVGRNIIEPHPLGELVARLWIERVQGGIIELHLDGGTILVPEWFDEKLSRKSHGMFAAQAADGTVTMTIVPWDEVKRVVVRGVVGLPDGMFE